MQYVILTASGWNGTMIQIQNTEESFFSRFHTWVAKIEDTQQEWAQLTMEDDGDLI